MATMSIRGSIHSSLFFSFSKFFKDGGKKMDEMNYAIACVRIMDNVPRPLTREDIDDILW